MSGGYVPIFGTVAHGTLCGRWPTYSVWCSILPLGNARGEIDMTPQAISALTGIPLELLMQGLAELQQPDPMSRSQAEEGRRLVPLDPSRPWGWRIVNHSLYREKARLTAKADRERESGRNAERMRARRGDPTDSPSFDPPDEGASGAAPADPAASDVTGQPSDIPSEPPQTAEDRRSPPGTASTNSNSDPNPEEDTRSARARAPRGGRGIRDASEQATVPRETFLRIRKSYPAGTYRESNWLQAEREIAQRLEEGEELADLVAAAAAYGLQQQAQGNVGGRYVLAPQNFFGPQGHWRGPFPVAKDPKVEALAVWNGDVLPSVRAGDYHRGKTPGGRIDVVVRKLGGYDRIGQSNVNDPTMRNRFIEAWLDTPDEGGP